MLKNFRHALSRKQTIAFSLLPKIKQTMNRLSPLKQILVLFILLKTVVIWGQKTEKLEQVYINKKVSTHFVMNDPIKYVDISTEIVAGDIALKNVLRVKPLTDSIPNMGIITIATEREMVQYELVYTPDMDKAVKQYIVKKVQAYRHPDVKLSEKEMIRICETILMKKSRNKRSIEKNKISVTLNNIYVLYDHYFLDISVENESNIDFEIDQIRFKVEDEKITKATNFQQLEVHPKYQQNKDKGFSKSYRNVFVFEKFTFPDDKVLTFEIAEKQMSGRAEVLKIKYKDVLNADNL
jgi:conjugative transposon TraN protein